MNDAQLSMTRWSAQPDVLEFIKIVSDFYHDHGRHDLPWRQRKYLKPYPIVVSEIMLQQTQVDRVIPYFKNWLSQFPNFQTLANATTADVLRAWAGLGYNRRGLYLYRLARIVMDEYDGELPREKLDLLKLPGIGPYVAGAVRAFVWNEPEVFIETNIRRVFIHHFFSDRLDVSDTELLPIIQNCLDLVVCSDTSGCHFRLRGNDKPIDIRHWYYALMDYGATLPKIIKRNPNMQSKHYAKQSAFAGSRRQVRGEILRRLGGTSDGVTVQDIESIDTSHPIHDVLADLESEGFIELVSGRWRLKK